jgi:predicted PurR-regulated permease PerM
MGLLSLIVGGLAMIAYLIIGLPNAVILAIFAGIMEAVPVIGPALGALPAIIVALTISPGAAIAVIVVSVLIQAAENIWIFPRVMGSSLGVSPFLTLITMFIFSTLFGVIGAFIAIPVTAVAKVLVEAVVEYRRNQAGDEMGRDRMGLLRYEIQELVADIRAQTRSAESTANEGLVELEDSLEMIALDLDALLQISNSEDPQ